MISRVWLPPRPLYSFGTRKRSCNEIPERYIGLIQATLLRDDVHGQSRGAESKQAHPASPASPERFDDDDDVYYYNC